MEYPRVKPERDRRRRLMPADYDSIKILFDNGYSKSYLARKYKVSIITISRVLDPELREFENKRKSELNKNKWNTDPNYRIKKAIQFRDTKKHLNRDRRMLDYNAFIQRKRRNVDNTNL